MTSYTELLALLRPVSDGALALTIPEDWMQGRTTYGGLTAALCLEAARRDVPDLPVRSAQVAFVGPVGGAIRVETRLLRRGKNTAFVRSTLSVADAIMAECLFTFGAARQSALKFAHMPMPEVGGPDEMRSFFASDRRPNFSRHFNMRQAYGAPPISASSERCMGIWLRSIDPETPMDATAILAIADCPPPAAMPMMAAPAPISSMTWMAEFLTDHIDTEEGWWFSQSTAEIAMNGYSSQDMRLWSRSGTPILVGRQTVAVFG